MLKTGLPLLPTTAAPIPGLVFFSIHWSIRWLCDSSIHLGTWETELRGWVSMWPAPGERRLNRAGHTRSSILMMFAGRRNPRTEPRAGKGTPSPMDGSNGITSVSTTASRVCRPACSRLVNRDDFIDVWLRLSCRVVAAGARSRGAAGIVGHASSFLLLILAGHYRKIINLFLFGCVSGV